MRRAYVTGLKLQFWLIRRQPDDLLSLCTLPFTAVVLLSVVVHAARPDLVTNALLAPALIGLWTFAIAVAGDLIQVENWLGTLELTQAGPTPPHPVLLGRISAVMLLGVLPLGETWLLGWLLFDRAPAVHHPGVFAAAMVLSLFAMAGTALVFCAGMLLSRNGGVYQNFLSFPIYLLSGVMVPVSYLPDFLEPLSWLVFLSWSAELMRDALTAAPIEHAGPRLLAIGGLGVAGLLAGWFLLSLVLRLRRERGR